MGLLVARKKEEKTVLNILWCYKIRNLATNSFCVLLSIYMWSIEINWILDVKHFTNEFVHFGIKVLY